MPQLTEALTKLASYRSRYEDGEVIDATSGLTAADLDVIIALAPALHLDVQGQPIWKRGSSDRSTGQRTEI